MKKLKQHDSSPQLLWCQEYTDFMQFLAAIHVNRKPIELKFDFEFSDNQTDQLKMSYTDVCVVVFFVSYNRETNH